MTWVRGRSESPFCTCFSNFFCLKYSVSQGAIFVGSMFWTPSPEILLKLQSISGLIFLFEKHIHLVVWFSKERTWLTGLHQISRHPSSPSYAVCHDCGRIIWYKHDSWGSPFHQSQCLRPFQQESGGWAGSSNMSATVFDHDRFVLFLLL